VFQWLALQTYLVALELRAEHAEQALKELLSFKPEYEPGLKLKKLLEDSPRTIRNKN
jgi:hypothetical protein